MKNLFYLISIIIYAAIIPELKAQCDYLKSAEIRHLASVNNDRRIKKLNKLNAKLLSIQDDDNNCSLRTYVLCKVYINDTQWHWQEILSFNSCDQILSYSTSSEEQFQYLKNRLLNRRYHFVEKRSYNNLDFDIYQDARGRAIELNTHPNPQGKIFYLINILR
ncbi:MAG: hypothetical protein KDC80_09590 [Saprospiraceae bacterium]|nr:hypothetical protein [Saprospiraceae bacterium]